MALGKTLIRKGHLPMHSLSQMYRTHLGILKKEEKVCSSKKKLGKFKLSIKKTVSNIFYSGRFYTSYYL